MNKVEKRCKDLTESENVGAIEKEHNRTRLQQIAGWKLMVQNFTSGKPMAAS